MISLSFSRFTEEDHHVLSRWCECTRSRTWRYHHPSTRGTVRLINAQMHYVLDLPVTVVSSVSVKASREAYEGLSVCIWGSRARWSGFEESRLPEVSHDERHTHQCDADAQRGEELVYGVRQNKRARAGGHLRLNHRLTEAQLTQQRRHVQPAENTHTHTHTT